jgi:hypothetical protein
MTKKPANPKRERMKKPEVRVDTPGHRPAHGGQAPTEERGMRPTNQGSRPVKPPPKPSDIGKQ